MSATPKSIDAAAVASSVILMNLLQRLADNNVLPMSDIRDVLALSAKELQPARMTVTSTEAISLIEAMLGKLVQKDVYEN
jgi:hypothetical protein